MFSLRIVSDRLLGFQTDIFAPQGRDLESAFEAGPSSSSGQQDGREVPFKGVGTFQVDARETHHIYRNQTQHRLLETEPRPSSHMMSTLEKSEC